MIVFSKYFFRMLQQNAALFCRNGFSAEFLLIANVAWFRRNTPLRFFAKLCQLPLKPADKPRILEAGNNHLTLQPLKDD